MAIPPLTAAEMVCQLAASFWFAAWVTNHQKSPEQLPHTGICVVRYGFETPGCACSGGQG